MEFSHHIWRPYLRCSLLCGTLHVLSRMCIKVPYSVSRMRKQPFLLNWYLFFNHMTTIWESSRIMLIVLVIFFFFLSLSSQQSHHGILLARIWCSLRERSDLGYTKPKEQSSDCFQNTLSFLMATGFFNWSVKAHPQTYLNKTKKLNLVHMFVCCYCITLLFV